ncbi:FcoT family thioesterase [Nocardia brasiliensis]|uniref:FcoT family thioesterase n=1 Tax=Nocardia brasiliensis TaxID=37326 RepID=UPI002453CB59|nr:FcoT family thioesterase [Nocardia brasiliensis]
MTDRVFPDDPLLLAQVLHCYKPHCRYLRTLEVRSGEKVTAAATFEIPDSCYIDATGHLNSVEVNICYNQMLYQTIAVMVREQLGVFAGWTMEDFWRRQLPDILITRFHSDFRRPIDPRRFSGEFTLDGSRERTSSLDGAPFTALDTSFRCWDDGGGHCTGVVRLAVVEAARVLGAAR